VRMRVERAGGRIMRTQSRLLAAGLVATAVACRGTPAPSALLEPLASSSAPLLPPVSASPSARSAAPTEGSADIALAESPPPRPSEASRCFLPPPSGRLPAALLASARKLKSAAELAALASKGKGGAPERMAIRVDGTFGAGCECPPFSAWFTEPNESFSPILTIPGKGVADIGTFRANLSFVIVGYFSGAEIDTYEYFRATGQGSPTPDEEERSTWRETHPEFCLEASCYWIPELRARLEDGPAGGDYAKFLRGVAAEHAAYLAKQGMPRCKREWMKDR
jgi:hypothetical protein